MKKLEVYDPALCCSTGVCGTSPDAQLAAFAGTLKAFNKHADISRYNLAQQPGAFAGNETIREILKNEGPEALPVILIDGKWVMKGVYPSAQQLSQLLAAEPEAVQCCGGEKAGDSCCGEEEKKSESRRCDESSCC